MKEKISIIIPVFNVERYLRKCIDSVINQTHKNLEIILIDDGSTDKSGLICDNYAQCDSRIIVVHKKNGGLSSARNTGIEISKSEYLFFLDSDDYISEDCIESLYEPMKKVNAKLSIGNYQEVYDGTNSNFKKNTRITRVVDKKEAFIEMLSHNSYNMSACNKLFKKSLFTDIKFPIGKKCEDYYVMYKLVLKSEKIILLKEPTYFYLQRQNSITKNDKVNLDFLWAAHEQLNYIKRNYIELVDYAASDYAMAAMAIYQEYKKRNIEIDNEIKYTLINVKKEYRKYVYKNKRLNFKWKLKYYLYSFMPLLFDIIFKIDLIRKKEKYVRTS